MKTCRTDYEEACSTVYRREDIRKLVAQVHHDSLTKPSDVQTIYENISAKIKKLFWIEGTTRRFDGYNCFGEHPELMLDWFNTHMGALTTKPTREVRRVRAPHNKLTQSRPILPPRSEWANDVGVSRGARQHIEPPIRVPLNNSKHAQTFHDAYAASRIKFTLNGRTNQFGWLQAPATVRLFTELQFTEIRAETSPEPV